MSEHELGAQVARFQIDAADERTLAKVRTVSAALAIACGALLVLGTLPLTVFLAVPLAMFVSFFWLRQASKAAKRARAPEQHYLAVYEQGFVLGDGEHVAPVAWSTVRDVEVDEETLTIVVSRHALDEMRLDARYPGIEIHELMRTLRNAWQGYREPATRNA